MPLSKEISNTNVILLGVEKPRRSHMGLDNSLVRKGIEQRPIFHDIDARYYQDREEEEECSENHHLIIKRGRR